MDGGIGSSGGSSVGGAGCSGELGAVVSDSSELNVVTGDVNHDC